MTKNQKAMREICDELGGIKGDVVTSKDGDLINITIIVNGKYLSLTLYKEKLFVNKLNEVCHDKIIQAVKNSSFIGGLVVPTTYKIGS